MKRFAVYTFGACGSKWLARELNRAPGWTVEHEPGSLRTGSSVAQVRAYMDAQGDHYGLVDPRLRRVVPHLGVKVGVLIRNPFSMALSAFNRNPHWLEPAHFGAVVEDMRHTLEIAYRLSDLGAPLLAIDAPDLRSALLRFAADVGVDLRCPVDVGACHQHGREALEDLMGLGEDRLDALAEVLTPAARAWGYA